MRNLLLIAASFSLIGCASITNDAMIPVTMSFSNGESGTCNLRNKRWAQQVSIPSSFMVRRSDDGLQYDCSTESGKKSFGQISSETDATKFGASILFIDLGITDAITDKHRTYQSNIVLPVAK